MFKHTLYKNVQHFTVFYFHASSYLFSATFELDPVMQESLWNIRGAALFAIILK